ncbi:YIP1 family protein [Kineobactrum salinum]|nr:YIP1 family protein [Kineobactrum salinum]
MGLVTAVWSLFGSTTGMLAAGLGAIIVMPIFAVIGAFIGAAILFVIWRLMGSGEDYETAFRCQASVAAIYPVTALLAIVPYLGTIITIAWGAFLLVEASVSVHGRERKTAQIVFGVLAVLMILSNIASERAARQMERRFQDVGQFENMEDMSPEEAGRKMGEFFKGLEESSNRSADGDAD